MVNYKGLTSIELYQYLAKKGYKYNPKIGTFRDFVKSLRIISNRYNNSDRFMKTEIDLALSKIEEKSNDSY